MTYFYSSLFFPKNIRDDVFILYSFVRTADNYVDAIPQQKKAFNSFFETYKTAVKGKPVNNTIITAFIGLMNRKNFDPLWVDAFLNAMRQDMSKTVYMTITETEEYMYGSAEVIGLMMAAIMELPIESHRAAQKLGKAMQYINFIRDIQEDIDLGRMYLPFSDIKKAGLKSLLQDDIEKKPDAFSNFIRTQLDRYELWQDEAEEGFRYIPRNYRIPIKTASDMYKYTATQIRKNPMIIYKKKVKPGMYQIIGTGIKNSFTTI
jgi:phytoene synthase